MSNDTLKEALNNCLINFDRRVLVTDLLQEYELPYEEVQQTLVEHVAAQEKKGTKYEKRFLVHGEEQQGSNEVYTVVEGEAKLQEWLGKLKNAESSLYSVEVVGGARTPAQIFKPLRHCAIEIKNLEMRSAKPNGVASVAATSTENKVKAEPKAAVKQTSGTSMFAKKSEAPSTSKHAIAAESKAKKTSPEAKVEEKKVTPDVKKVSPEIKKVSPEVKKSPTKDKKSTQKVNANKKGINNFFAPASKTEEKKDAKATGVIKPPTPKKMQDFFKKQADKPTTPVKNNKKSANTSVQLFTAEDNVAEIESDVSSDEEEKLDALRRDIISTELKIEADASTSHSATTSKRRRIEDSDDEEQPEKKHDKVEADDTEVIAVEEEEEAPVKSETFLDDEGFVITIKPKKSNVVRKPAKVSPPNKTNNNGGKAKSTAAATKPKSTPTATPAKTKQGNIMSFFSKK